MLIKRILSLINKTFNKIQTIGLRLTISRIFYKIALFLATPNKENETSIKQTKQGKIPEFEQIIINSLEYHNQKTIQKSTDFSKNICKPSALEFIWLIPYFSKGSGGHKNLFRFVKFIELFGCKCTIYIVGDYDRLISPEQIQKQICEYFEPINAEVKIYNPTTHGTKTNILVSTSWITAYAALTIDADLKTYFVQDYEPLFYSLGSYYYLAQNTYSFGYYHITLGQWLTNLLQTKHQVAADFYHIVVEKDIYYPRNQINNQAIRELTNNHSFKIAFYGRSVTPRRCFELVSIALHLFSQKAENITLISYGWNDIPTVPFKCYNVGMLSVESLAELYSVCDVCIAPSSTNLSLVAHEVMACGSILMDLEVENTSYDLVHLENSYLVEPNPQSMCDALLELYNHPELRQSLKAKSLEYIDRLADWNEQGNVFHQLINQKLDEIYSDSNL
ncbi:glycosyltransferase [Calothrix sp. PCC 6303]|uniref:glycosyltransferase n=1 Tax=Calothrix sp. PCC 6303 TaxID=1170562 RepID=UPI0002A028AD|nr:glycosyltransferase [Calothrix sp. PCC 6303]AFZ03542.1 glycosyl transferase group 1 [Calothrix sp. PCC 6303]